MNRLFSSVRYITCPIGTTHYELFRKYENWGYGPKFADVEIKSPVFVLGHYRNGTTHLHNLLTIDDRFAFPNTYQTFFPYSFLPTEAKTSPVIGLFMPRQHPSYDRYLTFRDIPDDEIAEWRDAFVLLLKKLTWKYDRSLVLKSPPHTARMKLLLEMFPQAKFVHIHRDPFTVFQSTKKILKMNFEMPRLQRFGPNDLDEWIIRQYKAMYDVFF